MTRLRAAALAALVAAGAASAQAGAAAPKAKVHKATVGSVAYEPGNLKIRAGDKIRWTWSSSLFDGHDVTVERGPEKFSSPVKSSGSYTRTFKKAGSYLLVCTQHPGMSMTVKVAKKKR